MTLPSSMSTRSKRHNILCIIRVFIFARRRTIRFTATPCGVLSFTFLDSFISLLQFTPAYPSRVSLAFGCGFAFSTLPVPSQCLHLVVAVARNTFGFRFGLYEMLPTPSQYSHTSDSTPAAEQCAGDNPRWRFGLFASVVGDSVVIVRGCLSLIR